MMNQLNLESKNTRLLQPEHFIAVLGTKLQDLAVENSINKPEGNPQALNSWDSDCKPQTTKQIDDQ